jgi:hypothetical protein
MMDRDDLLSTISDLSKDARGFRDRTDYSDCSTEELLRIADAYNREAWVEEYLRLCYDARVDVDWAQLSRMSTAELAHRCDNFKAPSRPTSGAGWALSEEVI